MTDIDLQMRTFQGLMERRSQVREFLGARYDDVIEPYREVLRRYRANGGNLMEKLATLPFDDAPSVAICCAATVDIYEDEASRTILSRRN